MYVDVVIIGAGPCGLAAAARLREQTPSALFTSDEHARFWKRHKQQQNSLEKELKQRNSSVKSGYARHNEAQNIPNNPSMLVLDDSSDQWLGSWTQRFHDLSISHLRSPLFFHPDPRDRDGLLAFAHEQGRLDELCEIPNVAGKELSKHERKAKHQRKRRGTTVRHLKIDGRDQIDYFAPSAQLFHDYCEAVVDRYKLQGLVQKAKVKDVIFTTKAAEPSRKLFTIYTEASEVIRCRVLVIATGASIVPSIPPSINIAETNGSTHVFEPEGTTLPPYLDKKLRESHELVTILVVGGGLTSAQIIGLLLTRYHRRRNLRIHLLLRHAKLKVKPFDIDLPWVSKTRNHLMSSFYLADSDHERMKMLRQARNGGSVTPRYAKILQQRKESGQLNVHVSTELDFKDARWDIESQLWHALTFRSTKAGLEPLQSSHRLPDKADHIIYCTSTAPSMHDIPWLRTLRQSHPIETLSGLPVLTEDLAWCKDVPCFFSGALAALRLGPGAANLMGARLGAERIAWAVEDFIGRSSVKRSVGHERSNTTSKDKMDRLEQRTAPVPYAEDFTGSFNNQFASLSLD